MNSSQDEGATPKPTCFNCRFSKWSVGIGGGFTCLNEQKMDKEGIKPSSGGYRAFNIPDRGYVCEFHSSQ